MCPRVVVVDRVKVHVDGGAGAREERHPLPAVVLGVEHKVGGDDGDARGDEEENDVGHEQEAVDVVVLVVPERGEEKVDLDKDAGERQQATGARDDGRRHVPRLVGQVARHERDAARYVGCAVPVAAKDRADHGQRHRDEDPQRHEDHHGAERNERLRVVVLGAKVEHERRHADRGRKERRREEHGLDPALALAAHVVAARRVAGHDRREHVANDRRRDDRATTTCACACVGGGDGEQAGTVRARSD